MRHMRKSGTVLLLIGGLGAGCGEPYSEELAKSAAAPLEADGAKPEGQAEYAEAEPVPASELAQVPPPFTCPGLDEAACKSIQGCVPIYEEVVCVTTPCPPNYLRCDFAPPACSVLSEKACLSRKDCVANYEKVVCVTEPCDPVFVSCSEPSALPGG